MDARFGTREFEIRKDVLRQTVSDYIGIMLGRFCTVYDDDLDARAYVGDAKICDMVPRGPAVEVKVGQNRIEIVVKLAEDKDAGIVCGPNKCNIVGLLNLIRMQQIIPHNKATILILESPTRKPQLFKDYNLFSLRGELPADDFYKVNGINPPHLKNASASLDEPHVILPKTRAVGKSTMTNEVFKHVRGVDFKNPVQGAVAVERMKQELDQRQTDAEKLVKDLDNQFNALFSSALEFKIPENMHKMMESSLENLEKAIDSPLMKSLEEVNEKLMKNEDKKSAKLRKENK